MSNKLALLRDGNSARYSQCQIGTRWCPGLMQSVRLAESTCADPNVWLSTHCRYPNHHAKGAIPKQSFYLTYPTCSAPCIFQHTLSKLMSQQQTVTSLLQPLLQFRTEGSALGHDKCSCSRVYNAQRRRKQHSAPKSHWRRRQR